MPPEEFSQIIIRGGVEDTRQSPKKKKKWFSQNFPQKSFSQNFPEVSSAFQRNSNGLKKLAIFEDLRLQGQGLQNVSSNTPPLPNVPNNLSCIYHLTLLRTQDFEKEGGQEFHKNLRRSKI